MICDVYGSLEDDYFLLVLGLHVINGDYKLYSVSEKEGARISVDSNVIPFLGMIEYNCDYTRTLELFKKRERLQEDFNCPYCGNDILK